MLTLFFCLFIFVLVFFVCLLFGVLAHTGGAMLLMLENWGSGRGARC